MDNGKLKVAVVTGGHPFDVQGVEQMFRSFGSVDHYTMHIDNWAATPDSVGLSKTGEFHPDKARASYDVVVFFTMLSKEPLDEGAPWYAGKPRATLEQLGETEQGIVVWHHGLLQYRAWPKWNEIVGMDNRAFKDHMDQNVRVDVANPGHPITKGVQPFELTDEMYKMADADPAQGNDILLTVDNENSGRTVGWTRQHKKSRVFCLQLGHDNQVWSNPSFRTIFERGIQWCAKKI